MQLQFERAAVLRDQLAALKRIQAQQIVTADDERDVDVICIVGEPGEYAISVMLVRGGRNLGTTSYFPRGALGGARRGPDLVHHAVLRNPGAAAGGAGR